MTVCASNMNHMFSRSKRTLDLAKKYVRLSAIEKMRSRLLSEIKEIQKELEEDDE